MSRALPKGIKIGIGHSAATLYAFPREPYFQGLVYPRQIVAADGTVYEDGYPTADLTFKVLEADEYGVVMGLAGLSSAKSALVTVQLPDTDRITFTSYNGTALAPNLGQQAQWGVLRYSGVLLRITRLVAI